MRVRTKLFAAVAVAAALLITQIIAVGALIRELQSAASFIGSAHRMIEANFEAQAMVAALREEVRRLPSRTASEKASVTTIPETWQQLAESLESELSSETAALLDPAVLVDVRRAFSNAATEYGETSDLLRVDADLDSLIERAIYFDKALEALSESLDALTIELRKQLQAAVDREREIHDLPMVAAILIGGLTVLMLLAFAWLYVDRNLMARVTALSEAMLAIARGDLRTKLPTSQSRDEVGEMAKALTVFRDTAVEIEEKNLREVAVARQRLIDAIEAISEGFALYDADDRLILCNSRYREILYAEHPDAIVPGMSFEETIRQAVTLGLIEDAIGREEEWITERLVAHRDPIVPLVHHRKPDRWIQVSERRIEDGGTVAVYSDISELKRREADLTEKTVALEALSAKLAKYLAPQIYDSIFTGRQDVKIASQRKKLTVCFSDIAGFTEITDKMESEDLTQLLNHYLTEMSRIALDYGATIDKYVGDGIVMFFGDPETCGVKEDALACVKMALAMQKRIEKLGEHWHNMGIETPLRCRIGIHTGYCTVGNFGGEDRIDYTIVGGAVNLASRLEREAPPGTVLVSYETFAHVRDEIYCEERGQIRVRGMAYPVATYCVRGQKTDTHVNCMPMRAEMPHLRLEIDPTLMTDEERRQAATTLHRALGKLEPHTDG